MPELPEVEHLRRTLAPALIGARVKSVRLRRRDVVRRGNASARRGPVAPVDLLQGLVIKSLLRHGKNLAIVSREGPAIGIHLGMSGQMRFVPSRQKLDHADHVHCMWNLQTKRGESKEGRLVFRDPRRFGGIWTFSSFDELRKARWSALGPDALTITAAQLRENLRDSRRPIKAALLDQRVLAGVGNIYADEALFMAGIHPCAEAASIAPAKISKLAMAIRKVLGAAIDAGGSTFRSYVDANGRMGDFSVRHAVYGRGQEPCLRCGRDLSCQQVSQRTTVFCRRCQPVAPSRMRPV